MSTSLALPANLRYNVVRKNLIKFGRKKIMLKDLKNFLLRGNVVDLAVGVIIATAFGAIITSFVNDIITPLLLNPALEAAKVQNIAELAWNGVTYGKFLSAVINFVVVGTVLFFMIKAIEKAQNLSKKEEVV